MQTHFTKLYYLRNGFRVGIMEPSYSFQLASDVAMNAYVGFSPPG
jgi:hypothetical protein